MRTLLIATLLFLASCSPRFSTDDGRVATSLTGVPLMPMVIAGDKRPALEAAIQAARLKYESTHAEADAIALGKACAAIGDYRAAIDAYTDGLFHNPDSYRLRRHRGHRFITTREFRLASKDFQQAWELAQKSPDAPESADGSSTDRSAILYHHGLLEYLRHQWDWADETFAKRATLPTLKDENIVSAAHWHYWALRRAGREVEAKRVIAPIRNGMEVAENKSYYTLCRLYAGLLSADEVERSMMEKGELNTGLAYGLACWKRFELHDPAGARALLDRIVATKNWTSFGFIAAESDLAAWDEETKTK